MRSYKHSNFSNLVRPKRSSVLSCVELTWPDLTAFANVARSACCTLIVVWPSMRLISKKSTVSPIFFRLFCQSWCLHCGSLRRNIFRAGTSLRRDNQLLRVKNKPSPTRWVTGTGKFIFCVTINSSVYKWEHFVKWYIV